MALAIIKTGGKQYKVQVGDRIDIEKIPGAAGETAVFDQVLLYSNNGEVRIGDPVLEGARVQAKVLDQHRADKVVAFKYKRRKGFHKKRGHRRCLTRVQIETISA